MMQRNVSASAALLALLLALGIYLTGCAPATAPALETDPEVLTLRILHTNDFHGRLTIQEEDGRELGGAAVLSAHLDSARAQAPGKTILVDAGDVMQGTPVSNLSWGQATIDTYNRLGFDGVALGNHEFDWGVDTLRVRIGESSFPWLAANLFEEDTGEHPDWVRPWVMIEREGIRTAILGLALQTTPEVVMAGRTNGLRFGPEEDAVDRYVPELRADGADFVVVVGHEGAVCTRPGVAPAEDSEGCEGRLIEIAESVTHKPDAFIGGHTHMRNNLVVDGVPVTQARLYSLAYGVVDLERRPDGAVRVVTREIRPTWADEVSASAELAARVDYWNEEVRAITERVVADLAEELSNYDRQPGEQALGNLIADAHRVATGADVGFVNVGSVRRSLPAGPVTFGDLFELQPFQNDLVSLMVPGAILREALEHALGDDGRPRAFVSGMTIQFDPDAPPGERVTTMTLDDGRVVTDDDHVTIGTTEFVARGGDAFTMLTEGIMTITNIVDVDALVDHVAALPQPVEAPATDRWQTR